MARIETANVKPIKTEARPVFDLVSRAVMRMTVTNRKVTINSMKIP